MKKIIRRGAAVAVAVVLTGCASMGLDFSQWADSYGKAVEKTQNENLLLNMVRAAYNQPLYFTSIPVVRGNGQVTAGASLSATLYNSQTTTPNYASPGATFTASSGFGFDMASLDNAEFVTGLLTPISPATVHYYVSQGIPRELLFHLFIERIDIIGKTETTSYQNDQNSKTYAKFVETLGAFLDMGLRTESSNITMPFGPPLSAQAFNSGLPAIVQGAAAGMQVVPKPGPTGTEYQLVKQMRSAKFCFARTPASEKVVGAAAFCGSEQSADDAGNRYYTFQYGGASLAFVVRSTRDIFNYLGNEIYKQAEKKGAPGLSLRTQESKEYNHLGHGEQLLVVKKNAPTSDDLVRVDYRGDSYSVPRGTEGHSAMVFTLMSQIVTLSKAVNLIPASTPVLVR